MDSWRTRRNSALLLLQLLRPEKQVHYQFYRCNGRIWISCLWFHLFLVLVTWSGRFVPISGSFFFCSDLSRRQCLGRAPASPAPFCTSRSPRTLTKWKEMEGMRQIWGSWQGQAGREALWISGSSSRGAGGRAVMWKPSVAGPGVTPKLPESSVAATTAKTHRAELFLCWSIYGE